MIWASKDVYQLQYLMIITRAIDNFTVGKFFDSAQSSSVNFFKKSAYKLPTLKVKIVLEIDFFHKEPLN